MSITKKNFTILVVDDELIISGLLKDLFEMEGYKVVTASGGKEALSFLNTNQFNLVISDINMPNGDGYQLANGIRRRIYAHEMKIIFYSSEYAITKEHIQNLGVSKFFRKLDGLEPLLTYVEKMHHETLRYN